jgi:tRNA-(ms[2]io[6]A)-hydroxylase
MKTETPIELLYKTPADWAEFALKHFDTFLIDHAACERKASAMGMQFVVRYHDKYLLIDSMIRFAREELYHFHQVCKWIIKRGLHLGPDEKNPYINLLLSKVRNGREEHLLDRLLVCGIVEARGHERFGMMGNILPEGELKVFYQKIAASEAGHHALFLEMANAYFSSEEISPRLNEFLQIEAEFVKNAPYRAAVH